MRYDPVRVGKAFDQLFQTYESFQANDVDAAMRVYLKAVEPYETRDIERAVQHFLNGSVPGHNPSFAPSAPLVGAECRRVMNLRLESEARTKAVKALPRPDVVKSPESMARVAAKTAAIVQKLTSSMLTDDAAAAKRLNHRPRYSVGDAEGDKDVA